MIAIKGSAFSSCCSLKKVSFPNTLIEIESLAFLGCENLREVSLPDSLTTIGSGAFSCCHNLEKIKMPTNVNAVQKTSFYPLIFEDCDKLYDVILPNASWENILKGSAWFKQREKSEYSRAMKSHFRKFGNQMSGSGNHLCNYASLLA